MHALFAGAAIEAILTTPPPPRVAPRIAAFVAVDTAAGVPSAGYLLTHRECVLDGLMSRSHEECRPYTGLTGRSLGRLGDEYLHGRYTPGFTLRLGSMEDNDLTAIYAPQVEGDAKRPPVTALLRTWDVTPESQTRFTGFHQSGRWHTFNEWYTNAGLSDGRRYPGVLGIEGFILRGLRLTGSPAELAALLRDCAASPHKLVRDYGRSLRALAGD